MVVPLSSEIISDICTPIEAVRILKNVSTHYYINYNYERMKGYE